MSEESASVDWRPSAPWENLRRRAVLLSRLRRFFDERGFLEVETPVLSAESVVDRHLDPLRVVLFDDPRTPDHGMERWLQTSPEFAMKRLLAAGATAIYQVARAFRGGERGPRHNSEFTLVEWYRVGDGYEEGLRLLDELSACLLERGAAERLSYREAFARSPTPEERSAAERFLADQALTHGTTFAAKPDDEATWADLAQALFNAKEFIFVP